MFSCVSTGKVRGLRVIVVSLFEPVLRASRLDRARELVPYICASVIEEIFSLVYTRRVSCDPIDLSRTTTRAGACRLMIESERFYPSYFIHMGVEFIH
jgi:hypothetical protein